MFPWLFWEEVDIQSVMFVGRGPMKQPSVLTKSSLKVEIYSLKLFTITALPFNDYFQYFGPDYRLEVPSTNMENMNSREYLDKIKYKF